MEVEGIYGEGRLRRPPQTLCPGSVPRPQTCEMLGYRTLPVPPSTLFCLCGVSVTWNDLRCSSMTFSTRAQPSLGRGRPRPHSHPPRPGSRAGSGANSRQCQPHFLGGRRKLWSQGLAQAPAVARIYGPWRTSNPSLGFPAVREVTALTSRPGGLGKHRPRRGCDPTQRGRGRPRPGGAGAGRRAGPTLLFGDFFFIEIYDEGWELPLKGLPHNWGINVSYSVTEERELSSSGVPVNTLLRKVCV